MEEAIKASGQDHWYANSWGDSSRLWPDSGPYFMRWHLRVKPTVMIRTPQRSRRTICGWNTRARLSFARKTGQYWETYYIVSNHAGPGEHVCNCGYMVASSARGRGLATAMCEHSQTVANRARDTRPCNSIFVAASNEAAVRLWSRLGFAIVGRLDKAFNHPSRGYVWCFGDVQVVLSWRRQFYSLVLVRSPGLFATRR